MQLRHNLGQADAHHIAAQCEAMLDKQLYDETPARDDLDGGEKKNTRLTNMGLSVYDEFDEAIVLTKVHRMGQVENPQTPEDHAYNARAHTFWDIMHRLRDSRITAEDYFWLCRRKVSKLSLSERKFFRGCTYTHGFQKIDRR